MRNYITYFLDRFKSKDYAAIRITGEIKGVGKTSVLYLGKTQLTKIINAAFFNGYGEIEDLGAANALFPRKTVKLHQQSSDDIVVTDILPWYKASGIVVPSVVDFVVDFKGDFDHWHKKKLPPSFRRATNKGLKKGYKLEFDPSHKARQYFYDKLLVPTIKLRHSDNAFIPSAEAVTSFGSGVGLLKLEDDIHAGISISLPRLKQSEANFNYIGLSEDLFEDRKQFGQATTVLYYLMFQETFNRGYNKVTLGFSSPCLMDGLFLNKARWGCDAVIKPATAKLSIEYVSDRADALKNARQFIQIKNGKLIANLDMKNEETSRVLKELQKRPAFKNLSEVNVSGLDQQS